MQIDMTNTRGVDLSWPPSIRLVTPKWPLAFVNGQPKHDGYR